MRLFTSTIFIPITLSVLLTAGCGEKSSTNSIGGTSASTSASASATSADPMLKADPQQKAVLDELATLGGKPIETLTAEEARMQPSPADAVKSLLKKRGLSTEPEPVGKVEDRQIAGPGGKIPVRIYWPKGKGPFPVLLYVHGGGFVIATNDTYDSSARALTNQAGYVVVSPEYRKAPEHKFPAAHDDVWATYEWILKNAASIQGDPKKVAVGGESAGGNMATETAITARDKNMQVPIHQLLVYPVADNGMDTESYRENAKAKPLSKAMMQWFFEKTATPDKGEDARLVPMNVKDLSNLPPATIITAEIDPLRSEGQQYAERLKQAGVQVDLKNFTGMAHEFFGQGVVVDKAKEAVAMAAANLRSAAGK